MSNLRAAAITGALWSIASRWGNRLLGFVNVAIVARILAPQDFGLLAITMLVVGFVEIWFSLGVESAVIQKQGDDRDIMDTAWTLRIIQGCLLGLILFLIAPLAATFMAEPRVAPLLRLIAVGITLSAFNNIGTVNWQKQLNFRRDFLVSLGAKLISVAVTILLAWWLRNYWALAWGILSGYVLGFVISYLAEPYRPRWCLRRWRDLLSFSQWTLLNSIIGYASFKIDEITVGRFLGSTSMGLYTMSSEVALMPTAELSAPVNRVLFPAFSALQSEPGRLAAACLNAVGMVTAITIPAGIGLALVAPEAVGLFLGAQWGEAAPLVAILALHGILRALSGAAYPLLMAIGQPRAVACASLVSVVIFLAIAGAALSVQAGILVLAWAKVVSTLAGGAMAWGFALRYTQITLPALLRTIWRPIAASALMAAALLSAQPFIAGWVQSPVLTGLPIKVVLGALVYTLASLALWQLSGRPNGFEQMALARTRQIGAALSARLRGH
jgi:O-antigen/teichoic acid export membrane protein